MTDDKYLNILHSCKVAEIATRNGRMRDVGNKECITEERANCQQWLFFGPGNQDFEKNISFIICLLCNMYNSYLYLQLCILFIQKFNLLN